MISLDLALQLREAGLQWQPALFDFFAAPQTALEDRVFVLSDMMAEIEILKGWPAITFNGAVEWALDYILQEEVVWMPREDQLRQLLEAKVGFFELTKTEQYLCTFHWQGQKHSFPADSASSAYGQALLYLLQTTHHA